MSTHTQKHIPRPMCHPHKQTHTHAHARIHKQSHLLKRTQKPLKFQHIAFAMRPAGNHRPSPPVKWAQNCEEKKAVLTGRVQIQGDRISMRPEKRERINRLDWRDRRHTESKSNYEAAVSPDFRTGEAHLHPSGTRRIHSDNRSHRWGKRGREREWCIFHFLFFGRGGGGSRWTTKNPGAGVLWEQEQATNCKKRGG